MVYRIFVEKKSDFAKEALALKNDLKNLLQIKGIEDLRIINRYDVENIEKSLFDYSVKTVFSEPQIDNVFQDVELKDGEKMFAVEYLPGQFDQRANSAAECIQIISKKERPRVATAKVYVVSGNISDEDFEKIKEYVINPVEAREASLGKCNTLKVNYTIPHQVSDVMGFNDFTEAELESFIEEQGLAMDLADLAFCQEYFKGEGRVPTITEIKVIDTYWSDHCRHTTFNTIIDNVKFDDKEVQKTFEDYLETRKELNRTKPVTLMDIGTIAAKYLKKAGKLDKLDESEEINACTVKVTVTLDGKEEDWLLLFKNETHNHPTEIEPFGGAATCVGGAIRDPLSGRSYVYSAMRVTGAGDPLTPVCETIEGKLPQRTIVTTAANGYSSYGNQIGLATGQVDELYHPGYVAKRMEIGAVIAAAPAENVKRERPAPGDVVILLGGKTGRDGCGGATGSSKSHTTESLETCGAEVQKGNAPEERKLQRLFRNAEASKMIKRCNDFGAGGVSVAIGELADGLDIDLNKVPKKYEGLDGTELAISESQERMAVVVAAENAERFCHLSEEENLEASIVARVTENPYLKINWNDKAIVNISRAFLDTNGAEKHIDTEIPAHDQVKKTHKTNNFKDRFVEVASDLNVCSKRGLSERFDSTIGAGTVLMPFGGKYQRTPIQSMVNLISSEHKTSTTCSVMSYGFNPYISETNPYVGAYLAVVESVSKLVAAGAKFEDVYLSFQEYFEKPNREATRWGKPLAAVLGAFKAQKGLGVAAIGGKDSMSGTFEDLDVPPTLVSFAVTTDNVKNIISPEFKNENHNVIMVKPSKDDMGLPSCDSLLKNYEFVHKLVSEGTAVSVYTPTFGGIAESILKMTMGNKIGFNFDDDFAEDEIFDYNYGAFILEINDAADCKALLNEENIVLLGETSEDKVIRKGNVAIELEELYKAYENKLEEVYTCNIKTEPNKLKTFSYEAESRVSPRVKVDKPKVLIPVFPGTNCEYDTAKAFDKAGAETEIFVINNLNADFVAHSVEEFAKKVRESQIIFIPGGFSGGDEPDGSGKLITAFFRNEEIKDAVNDLLENRDGLIAGICNGFQALIKLGLVPYGKIMDEIQEDFPTLTFNEIGRHQSKLVRTRISSNKSPWLANTKPGQIYTVPISHGEGRFIATPEEIENLGKNGQIITQYVDLDGNVTDDIQFNPNGSLCAIEGITSADGRVLGKMGHSERIGEDLYKNVPGDFDMQMFKAAVDYFRK